MITIVDYGVGNISSLVAMLDYVGADVRISGDPEVIAGSKRLLLPGVGHFAHAMKVLHERELASAIRSAADGGSLLMGVCLAQVEQCAG